MRGENNRGTLMVEAALIYPLFIFTIIAMLVLGLLKLEQTLVQFATTKTRLPSKYYESSDVLNF